MKKIDNDGLLLCELQAKAFEISLEMSSSSSEIFIRRFMNSRIAKNIDSGAVLHTNIQAEDILDMIEEQYGPSDYGSVKYTRNELYWIGYIYRYFSYTYRLSSLQVYKIVKPKELRALFLAYHTLDPANAIARILEAKNLFFNGEEEIKRQYEIFKKNRQAQ